MEDTLRDTQWVRECDYTNVLILVLMEDTLRGIEIISLLSILVVLILVLMEDTLRALIFIVRGQLICLNPCFNGRYSQS